jgi:DNA polymerase-3 subunit chi
MERWEFVNLRQAGLSPEAAAFRLAARHHGRGRRVLVRAGDAAEAGRLDQALWTVAPDSFLPHAVAGGPDAAAEPVLITAGRAGNPNSAEAVILLHPPEEGPPLGFAVVHLLLPAADGPELAACRELYRRLSQGGRVRVEHVTRLA